MIDSLCSPTAHGRNDQTHELLNSKRRMSLFLGPVSNIAIVQYTASGALDCIFSGDGKLKTDLGFSYPHLYGVAIQAGKILAVGCANGDGLLVRYTAAGILDTTFSGDGIVTTDWGGGGDVEMVNPQGVKQVAHATATKLSQPGADMLVTACPQCTRVLEEGMKKVKPDMKVLDITEIVARAIEVS